METRRHDGVKVTAGATIATVSGPLRGLLTGERSALNFLGHLSGVATVTRRFVDAIAGTGAKILDTRKTLPGVRLLQKYAVRCGGGTNHRMGLFDAVMIKDNHLAVRSRRSGDQSPAAAVRAARSYLSERTRKAKIVVEIDSLDQLPDALCDSPDVVLLDNMTLDELRHCVRLRNQVAPAVGLEASGGIRLDNVRSVAETGVERISVGALTHSAPSLDVAFDWQNGDSET